MRDRYLVPALLLLATIGVFWEVQHQEFLNWDETIHITSNNLLYSGSPAAVLRFWQQPFAGMYIPVVYTIWAVLALFARDLPPSGGGVALNPHVFHTANLGAHLLNVLLVYAILQRLVRRRWAAGAGAALFALHPLQVEPVAWVAGMKDLAGGFFSLLALWLYLAGTESPEARRPRLTYAAASAAFLLALLAKPSSMVVPWIALVLDHWARKRPAPDSLRALLPWVVASVPVLWITQSAQGYAIATPLWARPLVVGDALAFYLGKLVWPLGLCADYGRTPERVLSERWGYLTWLLPAALAVLAWRGRERRPVLLTALAMFAAGLLPVLGFFPFIFQQYSTVADRYAYLAMLGPALAVAWLLARARTRAVPAVAGMALAVLACLSLFQTLHWNHNIVFWTHTIEHNPRSWLAYNSLGLALLTEGQLDEAQACYKKAIQIRPDLPVPHHDTGHILEARGDLDGARQHYEEAIRLAPHFNPARLSLANLLIDEGKPAEAAAQCQAVLRLEPESVSAHLTLAMALDDLGKAAEGLPYANTAVRLEPNNHKTRFVRGTILLNLDQATEAATDLRQAVSLEPGNVAARVNLAAALTELGELDAAIVEYQEILRLGDFPNFRYNLAQLLARRGRIAEARAHYRQLLDDAPPSSPRRRDLQLALERLGKGLSEDTTAAAQSAQRSAGNERD